MNAQELTEFRAQKDAFFKEDPQSPLNSQQKVTFNGLTYFMPALELDLTVPVTIFEKPENIQIQTTTGDTRWYLRYGEFHFEVDSQQVRLTIFKAPPDHFFLPFVDSLAGKETYPAGRYLEPVPLDDGKFHINLNLAYNPYCAYGPQWNCPITPAENRLSVAIRAGEKMPQGEWVEKM